ncbi:hypothetical protein HK405_009319 [Cladochytrium tenue]|nr:hypothetical protein HK405_009319 [Cladochytrium tenue]
MDTSTFKAVATVMQKHYPERLARMIIFPTTTLFWMAWKLVKGCLDSATIRKVEHKDNAVGLMAVIDRENLFERYGGTGRDPLDDAAVPVDATGATVDPSVPPSATNMSEPSSAVAADEATAERTEQQQQQQPQPRQQAASGGGADRTGARAVAPAKPPGSFLLSFSWSSRGARAPQPLPAPPSQESATVSPGEATPADSAAAKRPSSVDTSGLAPTTLGTAPASASTPSAPPLTSAAPPATASAPVVRRPPLAPRHASAPAAVTVELLWAASASVEDMLESILAGGGGGGHGGARSRESRASGGATAGDAEDDDVARASAGDLNQIRDSTGRLEELEGIEPLARPNLGP